MKSIPDATTMSDWRKSSYSNGQGAECVEVADGHPGVVAVRDSKCPHGPAVAFTADSWSSFATAVKDRTFSG
ncbi:DUF397 domain-containing protein [Streptomyces lydicus]|uniref:DUF397 domain-containing protein n=1 Tax=Streptomyces lydicus TaxID=47763 RepID=UPI0037B52070